MHTHARTHTHAHAHARRSNEASPVVGHGHRLLHAAHRHFRAWVLGDPLLDPPLPPLAVCNDQHCLLARVPMEFALVRRSLFSLTRPPRHTDFILAPPFILPPGNTHKHSLFHLIDDPVNSFPAGAD